MRRARDAIEAHLVAMGGAASHAIVPRAQLAAWTMAVPEKRREGAQFLAMCSDLNAVWQQEEEEIEIEGAGATSGADGGGADAAREQGYDQGQEQGQGPGHERGDPASEAAREGAREAAREARVLRRSDLLGQLVESEIGYDDFERQLVALDPWRLKWSGGRTVQVA